MFNRPFLRDLGPSPPGAPLPFAGSSGDGARPEGAARAATAARRCLTRPGAAPASGKTLGRSRRLGARPGRGGAAPAPQLCLVAHRLSLSRRGEAPLPPGLRPCGAAPPPCGVGVVPQRRGASKWRSPFASQSAGARNRAGAVTSLRESVPAGLVASAGNLPFPRDPEKSALSPGDCGGEGRDGDLCPADRPWRLLRWGWRSRAAWGPRVQLRLCGYPASAGGHQLYLFFQNL